MASAVNAIFLEQARVLVQELEEGNEQKADQLLDEITNLRESSLYQELGKLTRDFHNALNSFKADARISRIAGEDIPDAKERLKYVIKMTEDAANKTLNVVEGAFPVCDSLSSDANEMKDAWDRFSRREMGADEFRQVARKMGTFLENVTRGMGDLKSGLNDVLMAQDFQDLTGQIILKVISLVSEVEENLVNLVRISGQNLTASDPEEIEQEEKRMKEQLAGPIVPGVNDSGAVSNQDEVDDLLSSLGF
ncbi:MAG: protein phosphatase CheZ [Gammaproteobacteria bacterium]|nr:MAG: protein phosphatase CheZ [Gammaproteobacteria bacterium]